ncbi:signal recognition particle-docking protein FtsY [Pseudoflavonifractor sp. 524-17]|uniref:signal recognition particle-docking protein FtsY n=1 Tax=Pseudoflavonifractor sp. 524-17 TaxID=2304577 RepID=UPI001A9B36BC|nr:signal recognition particle-docking protein FtsY [Pseudoflavonifractor sp. 524-17]
MGFLDKIKAGLTRTKENISSIGHSFDQLFAGELDDDFYDELEETLILSDMGAQTAMKAAEELRRRVKSQRLKSAEEGRACLREILTEFLTVGDGALKLDSKPSVALFIGVNGVGKTTTIGKLSAYLKGEGKRVLMAAADTFRAAAADQLEIWSERCGVDIVRQHEGADPAAVVFDALSAARARGTDVVLVDTAGRLHNKQNLMSELNKISRILDRELPGADRETLLVLDATTGQNGLIQAKQFQQAAGVTGIVLTKLDGSAKGGIVIAIAQELGVPVKFIGVGEGIDDLMPFDPAEFAKAFV